MPTGAWDQGRENIGINPVGSDTSAALEEFSIYRGSSRALADQSAIRVPGFAPRGGHLDVQQCLERGLQFLQPQLDPRSLDLGLHANTAALGIMRMKLTARHSPRVAPAMYRNTMLGSRARTKKTTTTHRRKLTTRPVRHTPRAPSALCAGAEIHRRLCTSGLAFR